MCGLVSNRMCEPTRIKFKMHFKTTYTFTANDSKSTPRRNSRNETNLFVCSRAIHTPVVPSYGWSYLKIHQPSNCPARKCLLLFAGIITGLQRAGWCLLPCSSPASLLAVVIPMCTRFRWEATTPASPTTSTCNPLKEASRFTFMTALISHMLVVLATLLMCVPFRVRSNIPVHVETKCEILCCFNVFEAPNCLITSVRVIHSEEGWRSLWCGRQRSWASRMTWV